ncbi:helix-turn-helix domain-containing protein [Streptococcus caviae]|uniref:helix-turn-helix domain-containing protein n=1 Tax=Streptococcus sp. 'caviae' TaxID=1915004 RepID=UPI00094BAAC5|nr:helix-turn-helix transcriptional regulator [Streptococcus sp. 'caviae']OLN84605.1 transcriptional regulator [Streptococcus sp. 'caviae']
MEKLQAYISKRIRILRTKQGMTQEQLEEKGELPTNYVYKLENLEPNIKIQTLEKIMKALDVDIATFFDVTLKEENIELTQLVDNIKSLPDYKQQKIISAINTLIQETK